MARGRPPKEEGRSIAEESQKTRKVREKIKKQLAMLDQEINTAALKQKTIEIHRWIARHADQRIVLKSKAISLFDENQNTARLSKKIVVLAEQITNLSKKK